MNQSKRLATLKSVLSYVSAMSFVVLMWAASFCLVSHARLNTTSNIGDLATLLFGAASVALFVFSIFIALVAVLGWKDIQKRLRRIDKLEAGINKEIRGRAHSTIGFLLGEMSMNRDTLKARDPNQMREAASHCQQGYELLKDCGEPAEFMALNNQVFYSCFIDEPQRRTFLLDQALRLMKAAKEHDSINLMLTAGRAILEFSSEDKQMKEACALITWIASAALATEKEKREASMYLATAVQERRD